MITYTGVGERIRERMLAMGFVRADGQPDVQRFCWDFRYDRTLVYAWLADKATPFKDLVRLAQNLGVSVEWLLTGNEREALARGKTERRQGRRPTVGSLLLALSVVGAGGFGSPSGGVLVQAGIVNVVQVPERMFLIRRWLRRWARPLLPQWVPA